MKFTARLCLASLDAWPGMMLCKQIISKKFQENKDKQKIDYDE